MWIYLSLGLMKKILKILCLIKTQTKNHFNILRRLIIRNPDKMSTGPDASGFRDNMCV